MRMKKAVVRILKVFFFLAAFYSFVLWTTKDGPKFRQHSLRRVADTSFLLRDSSKALTTKEKIALHFVQDTLPGLMRMGLVGKYVRSETKTILYVRGKLWKARTRFFQESLLTESMVYNAVNGYPLETQIVDDTNDHLYARGCELDRKEFFD